MKLKANLHFHTNDDPRDKRIRHSFEEGARRAAALGFDVLALSCHEKLMNTREYRAIAARCNILLIAGVERNIAGKHVVILNPDPTIENVRTFAELERYRAAHRDVFILAPHPFFNGGLSLGKLLEEHIALFDAIEQSWFYSRGFNCNKKARALAARHNLPFITTSDTHELRYLDTNYAVIDAKAKTIPAVFAAVREHRFENFSTPRSFWREIAPKALLFFLQKALAGPGGTHKI